MPRTRSGVTPIDMIEIMFEDGAPGSAALDLLRPAQWVTAVERAYRQESALTARRLSYVAALLCHRSAAERRDSDLAYATVDGARADVRRGSGGVECIGVQRN